MTVIPIKISPLGEDGVLVAWIGDISHKRVDIVLVGVYPGWIEMSDDGSSKNMVTIVEVMVIVVCVTKVNTSVPGFVACR